MTAYRYNELSFYSPLLDADACRLSVVDANGGEHFAIVPIEEGKSWRMARSKALGYIVDHIEAGHDPGEVML